MQPAVIERVTAPTAEVRALVAELDAMFAALYPPEQNHGLAVDALFQPDIRFFVARVNASAVGCGGVALLDGFAEVKRMYVREAARGTGVADAIMARLIDEARGAGRMHLRLEMGEREAVALRFYRRCGFRSCPPFGVYAELPPYAIAASLFLEKPL